MVRYLDYVAKNRHPGDKRTAGTRLAAMASLRPSESPSAKKIVQRTIFSVFSDILFTGI